MNCPITSIFRRYWGKYIQNVCMLVSQTCPILCDLMDCSLCSSIHGNLQARILEWVAIPFSRQSSWLSDWTPIACIAGGFLTVWATREAHIQNSKRKLCHVRLLPVCLPFIHLSIHPSLPPSLPSIHPFIHPFKSDRRCALQMYAGEYTLIISQ